ncbi:hypothetical protein G6F16_010955 [Rhizopus arrhizus]|nr:hypothetical protein G6F22_010758 [Rhizopus arrhizus]KAG0818079.1 hypothetical protein G6F20_001856 [Rhizopus arrhizus]KAG0822612.1 hypothetical protein G6F19_011264 [Rhizopus arrhizus]KAG0823485.1 hypothetical protein G6F18_011290 [Rhizopus arrhizus]KAG0859240.1 hypothetical protein G6F17_002082 [Rhizopus arrhizus]
MTSRFRKPVKRSRRLLQKDDDSIEHHITNIEDLVKKKKIKVEREKTLKSLFQELEQERINQEEYDMYGYKEQQPVELKPIEDIVFDDDYLLESDAEDVEENEIKEAAKGYLQPEEQENLEHVFQRTKEADEIHKMETDWKRPFFRSGVKYIRQPCLISRESTCGQKEIHLSELSSTSEGRSFLFASGCMKDWYNSAWKCSHYIYQWLFEVVALEPDKTTARNALSTLLVLWSLPGDRIQSDYPEIFKQRYIKLETFKSVLSAYHALPTELIENIHADIPSYNHNMDEIMNSCHQSRHIPLSQLGLMIKAFGFSIRLWRNAYMPWEIRYTIRILLQLSLDKTGHLTIQEIQTSIDNCLSALKETNWEIDVKNIANDICDIVTSTKQQVHLLDAIKTIYDRSHHLRRVIGITCLERCLERDVPGSIDNIPTDQGLIKQVAAIFDYPGGFFKKRNNIDYEESWIRIAMLDAAIGTDDSEIRCEKDTVLVIADELRLIGLQIGAKLGVMKKTLANEMLQRVWGRISFIIGRDHKIEA